MNNENVASFAAEKNVMGNRELSFISLIQLALNIKQYLIVSCLKLKSNTSKFDVKIFGIYNQNYP